MQTRSRKRLQLVLIWAIFFAPMVVAGVMAAMGWMPGTRSFGEGIVPQRSVEDAVAERPDGSLLPWRDPDWRWSVVALPGKTCGEICIRQLDQVHRARVSLNQKSARVRLVYLGVPPHGEGGAEVMTAWEPARDATGAFNTWIPQVDDGLALVLVKPDGIALTLYRDGFNASGLRKDLGKVTK
ncbi:hypothetical protein ACQQ2N_09460 [Dokdonella sp. MW10]|uniref:hypothetical protein n=1 Tax=Dokdonella sp. MW10 TaxID=2992926 RepID=UPI003F7EE721